MRKLLVIAALFLIASAAQGRCVRGTCRENHIPSPGIPESEKIGTVAGYEGFGQFIDDGGYGTDQSVLDQMEDMNEEYQVNEYDPRQSEASDIYGWLNAIHDIDDETGTTTCLYCNVIHTMAEYESTRDTEIDRLNELSGEIDDEWCTLVDEMRGMVSDDAYEDYMDSL